MSTTPQQAPMASTGNSSSKGYSLFPAQPAQRGAAVATLLVIAVLLTATVGYVYQRSISAQAPGQQWSVVDAVYLVGMVILAAMLVIHAGLHGEALMPRTMTAIAGFLLVPGMLVLGLVLIQWSITQEKGATAPWMGVALVGQLVTAVVPFVLVLMSAQILRQSIMQPARRRILSVLVAIGVAAIVIAIAAGLPWIAHAVNPGTV